MACTVTTPKVSSEDLQSNLDTISEFIGSAGGIENLSVKEDTARRMGSLAIVVVRVPDSTMLVEFEVLQSGGRYRVLASDEDLNTDFPTADPNPPTDAYSPSSTADA
jgi:hypothetical protein